MPPAPTGRVVDADGHVLEPADTWVRYLDPSYRDQAIRIAADADGYEVLLIDGRPLKTLRGQLGSLGGIEMDMERPPPVWNVIGRIPSRRSIRMVWYFVA